MSTGGDSSSGGLGQTAADDFDRDGTDDLMEHRLDLTQSSGSSRSVAARASEE